MGLLSPLFLSGLVLLGLPLWLHLLRQYRRNPQPFSSVMFFERRLQSSTKHRRLRYIALLLLRLALLVLLFLTFANPFVNRTSTTAGKRKLTVIAIDRSFSMRAGNEHRAGKKRSRAGVERIRRRRDRASPGNRFPCRKPGGPGAESGGARSCDPNHSAYGRSRVLSAN